MSLCNYFWAERATTRLQFLDMGESGTSANGNAQMGCEITLQEGAEDENGRNT